MQERPKFMTGNSTRAVLAAGFFLAAGLAGCGSSKPQPAAPQDTGTQRFSLHGRVVAVDLAKQQLVVDHEEIPGFMAAMTMPYPVKNPNLLSSVSPEDQITADVVASGSDVWLENIAVVKKADQAKPPAPNGPKTSSTPPGKP